MNLLVLFVAVAGMMLTYTATRRVLKNFSALESPRLIGAVVALLTGVSMLSLDGGVASLILIPYEVLGLSLLVLLLLKWRTRDGTPRELVRWFQDQSPRQPRRQRRGARRSDAKNASASDNLHEAQPTEE